MTKLAQIELTYRQTIDDYKEGKIQRWEAILTIEALIEVCRQRQKLFGRRER